MPQFSIILPYYNRRHYLERALRSVVAQTVRPLEVVLVDNGSTDASAALCRDFAAQHGGGGLTFVLAEEPRRGAAAARCCGADRATGEWLYFFDSDDEMSPAFLADVQALLAQHGEVDLVAAVTRLVFDDGRQQVRRVHRTDDVADQLLLSILPTQGMVVRRDFLQQVGGWNAALYYWDDWELGVRLLCAHPRVVWLRGVYHRIYQHADSITGPSFSARVPEMLRTFAVVRQALHTLLPADEQPRALLALAAREAVMAGKLRAEGAAAPAAQLAEEAFVAAGRHRLLLKVVCRYVGAGGAYASGMLREYLRIFCRRKTR